MMPSFPSMPPKQGDRRHTSSVTRTYAEALDRLTELQSNRTITQLFDKPAKDLNAAAIPEMVAWLRRAGYTPQDLCRLRHIHVAGTKGKGSVCAYATALLRKYRGPVGTYTSPHLVSPRERIAIDGEPVSQDIFAKAFFEVWDRLSEAAKKEGMDPAEADGPGSKPFYFRFLTILAWHIFLNQGVKDVVLECGIGGEYDATNVVPAEAVSAAVVTQLGIDHVSMLGNTVEEISWHKAGIFKPGKRAFTRRLNNMPGVMDVLRKRAIEKGAVLVELDDETVNSWGGVDGVLKGDFQKYNQAVAVMAIQEHLGMEAKNATDLQNIPDKMIEGLREAKIRGRGEVIEEPGIKWYLDGAHTQDSLDEVAKWFSRELADGESAILIFNQQERDTSQLLTSFLEAMGRSTGKSQIFSHGFFTTNDVGKPGASETRDMTVQQKAAQTFQDLDSTSTIHTFNNTTDAVEEARKLVEQGKKQKVLVTGSMHLVGGVLRALEPQGLL